MSLLLIIAIASIIVIVGALVYSKSKGSAGFQDQWSQLLHSKDANTEANNIRALTQLASDRKGHWEVIGLTSSDQRVNMSTFKGELGDIDSVEVTFHWDGKSFKGSDWTPLDKDNVFVFFKEE